MRRLILLMLPLMLGQALALQGFDQDPDFTPSYDWSIKLVDLFNQAVNETYGTREVIVMAVSRGEETDGFMIPSINECKIHYAYLIDWAVYNGNMGFQCLNLSDSEILSNIKERLQTNRVFNITSVISRQEAETKCGNVFPNLTYPWFNDANNINYDLQNNSLYFACISTVNLAENRCLIEHYSLTNEELLSSSETACTIQASGSQVDLSGMRLIWIIVIITALVVAVIIIIKKFT